MKKSLTAITQELSEKYWTSLGGSTPQSSRCSTTYHQSQKTIQVRPTRHAEHSWRSGHELISDMLLWKTSHERAKAGRPGRIYIQQLCGDTGCSLEDLPGATDDWDGWQERVKEICAMGWHDDVINNYCKSMHFDMIYILLFLFIVQWHEFTFF